MNKSTYLLIGVLVALGAAYLYFFSDVFYKPTIQVYPLSRPNQTSKLNPDVYLTSFAMDAEYPLTTIKVFIADDVKTNRYAAPVWHMVSEKGAKHQSFFYGERVRGMEPYPEAARPKPLQPDVQYKLIVEAGRLRGETLFTPQPKGDLGNR
jgi:hypothetical protein